MGKINKFANLYDFKGNLKKTAPIENEYKTMPPISHRYPGTPLLSKPVM